MKIDSHHHLWSINDTDYVWMTDEHDVIRRNFLGADLDAVIGPAGIEGTVAVQARQMPEETGFLFEQARINPRILGVVGWVPLFDNGGEPWLEKFASDPLLVGVRHVVHDEPDDAFILRPDFNAGIRNLARHDLVYDILIFAKHLSNTICFVDMHPNQSFVVDHIAKPVIKTGEFDTHWARGIRELAKREHVCCKLSGMVTEVRGGSWDSALLQPYFETVLEAFGAERLMFGSDWPVCLLGAAYGEWARAAGKMTSQLSGPEQEAIWGATANRIYGLDQGRHIVQQSSATISPSIP